MEFPHEISSWEDRDVSELRAQWQVPQLHILSVTASTNDDVRRLGEEGAESGAIVIAERQTAGRGRRGRHWHGTPGQSLHFSMLLRPPPAGFRCLGAAPVRVGLVALRALREQAGLLVQLKWPNDLVRGRRKLGGILCESVLGQNPFMVIGIGLNIGQTQSDFPPELHALATSLALETGQAVPRADIAGGLAQGLCTTAEVIAEPFQQDELDAIIASDALRGHAIEIDGEAVGTALGINEEGALLLRTSHGIRVVHTGTARVADSVS
ncbi:MAG: biotin--[acetyl-CoA-carboxylase] ligase [Longimicrobiales bacterium]